MSAAVRAAEREAERRQRQYARQAMISDAADAVDQWRARIRGLISLHTQSSDQIDWEALYSRPRPEEAQRRTDSEDRAHQQLDVFRPHWWDFLFGGSERRRQKLADAVAAGREQDEIDYRAGVEDHRRQLAEWEADRDLAGRLLAGEAKARLEVIEEMQSLSGQGLIGTDISFRVGDEFVHAAPHVHGDEIVPNVRRKQTQSGRLSETKMPIGEFNELYQDYVCSAALRVAGELFALLPLDEVYVTCIATMLDKSTGHLRDTPILSVQFVRDAFKRLDLRHIDPSDSLRNFVHSMDFKRTRGFAPVEPLLAV